MFVIMYGIFRYICRNQFKFKHMNPPKGYYRQLLKNTLPYVRIAFTHTPIVGCSRIEKEPVIKALQMSSDKFAEFYINGLNDGTLVAIVENGVNKEHYQSGELYFTT